MSRFKSDLKDYTLWFDGVVEVEPDKIMEMFMSGIDPKKLAVTELTPDLQKYNRLAEVPIKTKEEIDADLIDFSWLIPKKYLELDIEAFVYEKLLSKIKPTFSEEDISKRAQRTEMELSEYKKRNLFDVLKVLAYVIDEFKANNVVWGVGRGSSCASYVLYLMEVHSVDSVKFEIPIDEFLK